MPCMEDGKFTPANAGFNLADIPSRKTRSGIPIPGIGMGTFGSDKYSPTDVAKAVIIAAELGYRHFDCAAVYANEGEIGQSLKVIMDGGVPRNEIFVTSKLWNDSHNKVGSACRKSLQCLGLDYLDLYLVHWPFPNHHPPGCDVGTRSRDSRPFIHELFMETWIEMEKLVQEGLVREIGTSNITMPKLEGIMRDATIKPGVNEMEMHPHFQQTEFFRHLLSLGILPIGYSPIGSPSRPERDREANDSTPTRDVSITAPAQRLGIHPAEVCVKWAVQRGQIPIPFSVKPTSLAGNIRAAAEQSLSSDEMKAIEKADRNCRLIKGQVFLWKENQDWQDLWDVEGHIVS